VQSSICQVSSNHRNATASRACNLLSCFATRDLSTQHDRASLVLQLPLLACLQVVCELQAWHTAVNTRAHQCGLVQLAIIAVGSGPQQDQRRCALQLRMEHAFVKNQLRPGDPGYIYNKQVCARIGCASGTCGRPAAAHTIPFHPALTTDGAEALPAALHSRGCSLPAPYVPLC
jgi:hypothetical protein